MAAMPQTKKVFCVFACEGQGILIKNPGFPAGVFVYLFLSGGGTLPTITLMCFCVVLAITLRKHHKAQMLGIVIMVMVKIASAHIKRVELFASAVRARVSAMVKSQEKLVPIPPPTATKIINTMRAALIKRSPFKNWRAFSI